MNTPKRIQLKRTKGWRIPANTVIVDRRSKWGNPFVVGRDGDANECVRKYIKMLMPYRKHGPDSSMENFYLSTMNLENIQDSLRGKNLACWCKIGSPCHADFLLNTANEPISHADTPRK